jgi:hypothetical protein
MVPDAGSAARRRKTRSFDPWLDAAVNFAAAASSMHARCRQAMPMLGKPTVTAMTWVYGENGEPRNLASRDAYERAGITPPQLVQKVTIAGGVFIPERRRRLFVSLAGEARQPLIYKC